jgi:hypothetical protein
MPMSKPLKTNSGRTREVTQIEKAFAQWYTTPRRPSVAHKELLTLRLA